ncbi:sigma-54-dependent Fis family transcriptional regulator [Herbaspirillum sp. SJZ107]|uniref:sigma-54-dependent Fis family transcriptional regulator n=1 Tax=Herbaspirillum sp. SJZ107 TaxID=2572881 RepID=UPI001153B963|nr:sigma-54-dependent Fis family transcriptional regulator [Herbaspirillum sp. SJZ107]TQK00114.1 transcriptional regulator of acetoin/glycerol metabolism [Herbaspirillum sp. SJZ107]
MLEIAVEHVKRVHSVVHGRLESNYASGRAAYPEREQSPSGAVNRITQSWIRCLNEYKLDPGACNDPEVVSPAELRTRQERLADLQAVAKVEMANLYQQLAGSGYAIMLTDRDGVLLNYFGDPAFTHAASKTGLMPGALWSERVQGTNGMGTCLFERRPLTVHQDEHYLSRNIGLSCAAAPIFDHEEELVGVLDASGESHLAQQHTLALVSMSVQMIENRVFLQRFRHEYIVRFHNRPEFVGTLSEGAIALSVTGKVLAATRCALFQLGLRSRSEIVGRDIAELFNVTFCGLIDSSVRKAFHPVPIFETRSGARFFAVMYQPVSGTGSVGGARPAPRDGADAATLPRTVQPAQTPPTALDALHFGDPSMAASIDTARRVLERKVAILLYGETGTGKEMFARATHQSSSRAARPFVAINCASIPEALIESELFGYRSGAFTGASKDGQRGKLLQANGGTLFLDEIGDMPVALQARLLRVLEEREVMPLGSEHPVKLDIHLISATHCNLQRKIDQGEFREDLYYRLQGVTITLPPLRDRTDRRALIRHLADEESDVGSPVELDERLLALLDRQRWPGNVRQLRHLLRTMIALRETDCLTVHDLPAEYRSDPLIVAPPPFGGAGVPPTPANAPKPAQAADIPAIPVAPLGLVLDDEASFTEKLNPLESAERAALMQELTRRDWNLSSVARELNISRNTLYRKLQRLHIKPPEKSLFH